MQMIFSAAGLIVGNMIAPGIGGSIGSLVGPALGHALVVPATEKAGLPLDEMHLDVDL
jgi:hypothetical protein